MGVAGWLDAITPSHPLILCEFALSWFPTGLLGLRVRGTSSSVDVLVLTDDTTQNWV